MHFWNENVFGKIGAKLVFSAVSKHFWNNFQNKEKRFYPFCLCFLSMQHFSSLLILALASTRCQSCRPSTMTPPSMDFPLSSSENTLFAPSSSFRWPNQVPHQCGWIYHQRWINMMLCRSRGSLPDNRRWRRAKLQLRSSQYRGVIFDVCNFLSKTMSDIVKA